MNLDDVLAQPPRLKGVDDDRVRFYLEHRSLIETWAALRRETAGAISEQILDLSGPLRDDLAALGEADVELAVSESGGRRSVGISRAAWHTGASASPVQVALESEPSALDPRGALRVYACIRAKQGHPDADTWRSGLLSLAPGVRASMGRGWKSSPPRWVVWKYVEEPEGSWDMEDLIRRCRDDLLRLWVVAAPAIDGLLLAAPSAKSG